MLIPMLLCTIKLYSEFRRSLGGDLILFSISYKEVMERHLLSSLRVPLSDVTLNPKGKVR